jgi:hypothetical protein
MSTPFLNSLYFCTLRHTYCSRTCGRRCRFIIVIIIKVSLLGTSSEVGFVVTCWMTARYKNRLHTCMWKLILLQEK